MRTHLKLSVAPRVGVWIEISPTNLETEAAAVAPRVGVWIEILGTMELSL